jgi:hypothetical protein
LDPAGLGDGARVFARDLRLKLAREHLDAEHDHALAEDDLVDPDRVFNTFAHSSARLQRWHDGRQVGPRPPGRLLPYSAPILPAWVRTWAGPAYRMVYDPDGRPRKCRRAGAY